MLITVEITSASEFHAALNVLAIVPKIYIYFFFGTDRIQLYYV